MSTYGMFIERKESGAPQSAGNVVTVNLARLLKQPFGWSAGLEPFGGRMGVVHG
jgi:hypothetical protein